MLLLLHFIMYQYNGARLPLFFSSPRLVHSGKYNQFEALHNSLDPSHSLLFTLIAHAVLCVCSCKSVLRAEVELCLVLHFDKVRLKKDGEKGRGCFKEKQS